MTALEMFDRIGTHVYLEPVRGLRVRCVITNVKNSYGRPRVEIEPVEGDGKAWVNSESVRPCYPDVPNVVTPNGEAR